MGLKVVVDWGVLLHARALYRRGLPRKKVAKALGVQMRSLDRIAVRLADQTFLSFANLREKSLWSLLQRALLDHSNKVA